MSSVLVTWTIWLMLKSCIWCVPKSSGQISLFRQRPWHFLEERHYSIIPPLASTDFQAAQHCILSAPWSKALSKRLRVVSNWKRHSTAFPPFLESMWLFSNINKKFCFCKTNLKLHSLSWVPKIRWQTWHTKSYRSKSMLNTKESPVSSGNTRARLFLDRKRLTEAQLWRSCSPSRRSPLHSKEYPKVIETKLRQHY